MKIGDAGEAFFVFETEDDIPDSMVTSPILTAIEASVRFGETGSKLSESISARKFISDRSQISADFVRIINIVYMLFIHNVVGFRAT